MSHGPGHESSRRNVRFRQQSSTSWVAETFAYTFSWFSQKPDNSLQLCGVRVEYRVPVAGGGWLEARYLSAPGNAFWPRDSGTGIRYEGGGCISAFPVLFFSDGFESGDSDEWSSGAKQSAE